MFGGLDAAIVASQTKDGQGPEHQPVYKRFLGHDAGKAAHEADAVLLGHADAQSRIHRWRPGARQPCASQFLERQYAPSRQQAAVFTSWNVHRAIVEHIEGA